MYLFTGGDDGRETNSRLDGISSLFFVLLLRKYIQRYAFYIFTNYNLICVNKRTYLLDIHF